MLKRTRMNSFLVLDKNQNLNKNYLIEASAGTGKTFAIENIFVRLLIENRSKGTPLKIDQILVVTFTRAATLDLKTRIRKNIERYLSILKGSIEFLDEKHFISNFMDENEKREAIYNLEAALFCFDQAQIFTIHSFCSRMLKEDIFESDMSLLSPHEEKFDKSQVIQLIKNYFRTEVESSHFSPIQIEILLKYFGNDFNKMLNAVYQWITYGLEIIPTDDFESLFNKYNEKFCRLKSIYHLKSNNLLEDYEKQKSFFKKLKKENYENEILNFCALFDKEWIESKDFEVIIKNGLLLYEFYQTENKKKRTKETEIFLHYPNLAKILEEEILDLIDEARSPQFILANIAYYCKKQYKRFIKKEEKLGFDDFLIEMERALQNESFITKIQDKYEAAIIDEFQDTDPLQWLIFKKIFLDKNVEKKLFLVGDPKQSIYSFRQADIYTYLDALNNVGRDNVATLDTNYRSQDKLIEALNALFCEENCPELFSLPKTNQKLPYKPVKASLSNFQKIKDGKGSLYFCIATEELERSNSYPLESMENKYFLPFFISELRDLNKNHGFSFNDFAFLVGDRFQAERVSNFLKKANIPSQIIKNQSLSTSLAYRSLKEVVFAVLNPRDESFLKIALGNPLIKLTHQALLTAWQPSGYEDILFKIYQLREILFEKGFLSFFEALMASRWKEEDLTIKESLISERDGLIFYEELMQIVDDLIEHPSKVNHRPELLVSFFHDFEKEFERQQNHKADPFKEAVTINTLHSSKGLEYEIVFALGAIKRSPEPDLIIPIEKDGKFILKAVKKSEEYFKYCDELDAEKMRLLYVASTRAKERLYLPIIKVSNSKINRGTASPMEIFLAKIGNKLTLSDQLYEKMENLNLDKLLELANTNTNIAIHELKASKIELFNEEETKTKNFIVEPSLITIPGYEFQIQSFSSLNRIKVSEKFLSEIKTPQDFLCEEKTAHTLPSGNKTGNLLHAILEKINFHENSFQNCIESFTKNSPFEEWSRVIEEIVANVLTTPLKNFCLKEIALNSLYREINFTYPIDLNFPLIEGITPSAGFLHGIIDLVFCYQDKYYIVDWKSNWLGSSIEDYNYQNMERCMIENNYFFQAALYKEALKKYLNLWIKKPFEEIFGGTYYIFLRGVNREGNNGIFFIKTDMESVCLR